jgi:hypothetical protein
MAPEPSQNLIRRAHFSSVRLADEPLERADRDGPVHRHECSIVIGPGNFSAPTRDFTRRAANPAANRRKRIRPPGDQISSVEIPVGNRAHVTPRVRVHGAGNLARNQIFVVIAARDRDLNLRF